MECSAAIDSLGHQAFDHDVNERVVGFAQRLAKDVAELHGALLLGEALPASWRGQEAAKLRMAEKRKAWASVMAVLHAAGARPCKPDNCGTVCLCDSCHARRALAYFEPDWNP